MNGTDSRLLVLGGTSGIGRSVADMAIRAGVRAYVRGVDNYRVEGPDGRRDIERDIEVVQPTHIVYSVGINILDWVSEIKYAEALAIYEINVLGFLNLIQALIAAEVDRAITTPPSIVAISSDAAIRPMRTSLAYCASKAALEMAVKVSAREYAHRGWRINAVAPGKVADTPMTEYVDARVMDLRGWSKQYADAYEASSNALRRPATKHEVAQVVLDVLYGPPSLQGAIVTVNGGR